MSLSGVSKIIKYAWTVYPEVYDGLDNVAECLKWAWTEYL